MNLIKYRYRIFKKTSYCEDIGKHSAYGIKCTKAKIIINDISTKRSLVKAIVQILNYNQTHPKYIFDTVSELLDTVCGLP